MPSGTFGNEQRNQLYRPRLPELRHHVPAPDQARAADDRDLRWDIFNLFNTVNFGIPNKDISTAATFGTISSLSSDPRTMQLALRLTF